MCKQDVFYTKIFNLALHAQSLLKVLVYYVLLDPYPLPPCRSGYEGGGGEASYNSDPDPKHCSRPSCP